MPLSRPAGVFVSGYTYSDKENTWGTLNKFLLDQTSGRTDVVFFGDKNFIELIPNLQILLED